MQKSLLLLCLAALPLMTTARHLTPDEALSRAAGSSIMKANAKTSIHSSKLVYSGYADTRAQLYVFNTDNDGFVIVSADDAAYPVLGYSESGTFNPHDIPANMQWMLDEYAHQISLASDAAAPAVFRAPSRLSNISPLLTCKWNQSTPYNDMCPEISGTRAVTGCVATAMAQVMYYHKWPAQGVGEHTYTSEQAGTLTVDFSSITYDWDAMLPTYDSSSPDASKNAVAELMYSCGVSVDMDYGVDSSGAFSSLMANAFIEYFNYDKGAQYLSRAYFSQAEWEEMIYQELINGRPVLYDGQSSSGGHQFVCDGYSDGLFHINWGWGGMSDGYFMLAALDPDSQGIGGSTSGFNSNQSILIGLQKPKEGSVRHLLMTTDGTLITGSDNYNRGSSVLFASQKSDNTSSYFYNKSSVTINVNLGVKLTGSDGKALYYKSSDAMTLQPNYGYNIYYVKFDSTLPNGTYTVTPAFYDEATDTWGDILEPYLVKRQLIMTATDTTLDFVLDAGIDTSVTVTDLTVCTPVYHNTPIKVTAKISSEAEFTTTAAVCLFEPGTTTPVIFGDYTVLDLKPGQPFEMEYVSRLYRFFNSPVVGNTYELRLIDSKYNPISDGITVVYQNAPTETLNITLNEFIVGSGSTNIPADNIRIQGTVTCNSGYLASSIPIFLFPATGGSSLDAVETPVLFAEPGQSASFDIKWQYLGAEPGTRLMLIPRINGSININNAYVFTIEAPEPKHEVNMLTFDYQNAYSASMSTNTVAKTDADTWRAADIAIADAVQWYNPADFEADKVTYTRTLGHTNWAALYVPFDMQPDEWSTYASRVIEYMGDTEIDGETMLKFRTLDAGETLEANHPYIFKPTQAGDIDLTLYGKTIYATPDKDPCINPIGATYALYGIYEIKSDMKSSGAYALQSGNFHPAKNNGVTLSPFRVYLQPTGMAYSAPERISLLIDSDLSGITSVNDDSAADDVMYDINGRRVDNPETGIYILNGQKIYIK